MLRAIIYDGPAFCSPVGNNMTEAVLEATRGQVEAQRARDYFRYLEFEQQQWRSEQEESGEYLEAMEVPYKAAAELIDYKAIERRAAALIEAHEAKPRSEWRGEYIDNARTAIFEVLTAFGHLSRIELHGDPEEVNAKALERWLNGMQSDLPEHELKRRFREVCEELIIQEIQRQILCGELPPDTEVATESPYVVGMSDEAAERIGYRWRNKKGMTRSTGLIVHEDGTVTRVIEQINYSNSSAEKTILRRHKEGIATPRGNETDIDVLGSQLIYTRSDLEEGVVGIQRRIDSFAGEGIRFGEVPDDTTASYEELREVSALREAQVEHFAGQLADLEQRLDIALRAGEITHRQHNQLYLKEVKSIRRAICILQPEYTKEALGESLVKAYHEAHERMLVGDDSGAAAIAESVMGQEIEIVVCGIGEEAQTTASQDPALRSKLKEIREKWQWTKGKCRVENCPTEGNYVKVGPCQVCVGCQHHFDEGRDPRKIYAELERRRVAQEAKNIEQLRVADEGEITLRFEEIVGIGSAELVAYDGTVVVAEGNEALQLRRELSTKS